MRPCVVCLCWASARPVPTATARAFTFCCYDPAMPADLIDTLRSADVDRMDDVTLHELRAALHALERQIVDTLEERGTGFIS